MKGRLLFGAIVWTALVVGSNAIAQVFVEIEPNDTKATANLVTLGPGNFSSIQGNSNLATGIGLDYFRVRTVANSPGIYRYTLTLNSQTAGHTASIRGLNQIAAAPGPWPGPVGTPGTTDSTTQAHFIPTGTTSRVNTWYGFGKSEELYYRVNGAAATTSDYVSDFAMSIVTPTNIGTFAPGNILINTVGQTTLDTDLWVYDSAFNAIVGYGNDDESLNNGGTGATLQSRLPRTYGAGTYYLAMSRFQMSNNQGSPSDDDFRTGLMMDFPDVVVQSSTTTTTTLLNFQVTDSSGTPVTVTGPPHGMLQHEVHWYSFNVVPEPGTICAIGIGIAALAARRRRRA